MELKAFKKGDVIIEKGSDGTCAYIIESGKVEVSDLVNNEKAILAILEKNKYLVKWDWLKINPDRLRLRPLRMCD